MRSLTLLAEVVYMVDVVQPSISLSVAQTHPLQGEERHQLNSTQVHVTAYYKKVGTIWALNQTKSYHQSVANERWQACSLGRLGVHSNILYSSSKSI